MRRIIACALAALLMCASLSACADGGGEQNEVRQGHTASKLPAPEAKELREQLVGYWGRLGKTMHEFRADGTAIVGGMVGTYEISDACSLVMTSKGGTVTEYVWDDSSQQNYWSLDGDRLTVNGNDFERITETDDEP